MDSGPGDGDADSMPSLAPGRHAPHPEHSTTCWTVSRPNGGKQSPRSCRPRRRAATHRPGAARRDRSELDRRPARPQTNRRPRPRRTHGRTAHRPGNDSQQPRRSQDRRPPAPAGRARRSRSAQCVDGVGGGLHAGQRHPDHPPAGSTTTRHEPSCGAGGVPDRPGGADEHCAARRRQASLSP
jgi:hypothetical protein